LHTQATDLHGLGNGYESNTSWHELSPNGKHEFWYESRGQKASGPIEGDL